MHKSSWTALKVEPVNDPTSADLERVMEMGRKNLGRPIELPFGADNRYLLTVMFPYDPSGRVTYAEWTLNDAINKHLPPIWVNRTTDASIVLGMLQLEESRSSTANAPAQTVIGSPTAAPSSSSNPQFTPAPPPNPGPANNMPQNSGSTSSSQHQSFGVNLSGELADVDLFGVVQSISICKMTGRLEVVEGMRLIDLFFEDGTPVHASMEDALLADATTLKKGDEVILDVLMWKKGKFNFHSTMRTKDRSVVRRMDGLLVEAAALRDQKGEILKKGIDELAPLFKANAQMSEAEFETAVKTGVPADLGAQKMIFTQLKHGECLEDFLQRVPMPVNAWVPAIFNMSMLGLLVAEQKAHLSGSHPVSGNVDFSVISAAFEELLRPETQMLSYPLFLFFVQAEHKRGARTRTGYSVVIFDVRQNGLLPGGRQLKKVVKAFEKVKGEMDMVGHFQTLEFGFLLPFRNADQSMELCLKVVAELSQIKPEIDENNPDAVVDPADSLPLDLTFGVVSVPEDTTDLSRALLIAQSNRQNKTAGRYITTV